MSLEDVPPPSLRVMTGRLESIVTAWTIAATPSKRQEINQEFKSLAEEIKAGFGEEGAKAVNAVLAKQKRLNFNQGY